MKRRLSNTYKNLVDYIENGDESLADFLTEVIEEGCKKFPNRDNKLWKIIEDLYITPLEDFELGELTKTIVDIFEGNYELEEPKYYWQLKDLMGRQQSKIYLTTRVGDKLIEGNIMLTDAHSYSNSYSIQEFTKSEIESGIHDATLTIDNFTPVEEIEK